VAIQRICGYLLDWRYKVEIMEFFQACASFSLFAISMLLDEECYYGSLSIPLYPGNKAAENGGSVSDTCRR
jgi:hypothetical protein